MGGELLPLCLARRQIPSQHFRLKEYLGGTFRVSKTSDKKDALAPLGYAEELRVQYSPRQTVPERIHFGQELS